MEGCGKAERELFVKRDRGGRRRKESGVDCNIA